MQRVSPRHNKYYFPKIATSPLRDIIPHRARARIYSAATVRAHLETGASLCEQIHGVYRYLYVREPCASQSVSGGYIDDDEGRRGRRRGRAVPIDFALFYQPESYISFVRVRGLLRLFRDYYIPPYIRAAYISLSRASIYPNFIFIIMSILRSCASLLSP